MYNQTKYGSTRYWGMEYGIPTIFISGRDEIWILTVFIPLILKSWRVSQSFNISNNKQKQQTLRYPKRRRKNAKPKKPLRRTCELWRSSSKCVWWWRSQITQKIKNKYIFLLINSHDSNWTRATDFLEVLQSVYMLEDRSQQKKNIKAKIYKF